MIKLENFIITPDTEKTKVKFNEYSVIIDEHSESDKISALYALCTDNEEWVGMNSYKNLHPNNNLGNADYLIALARYYPYGLEYYVFGGLYKVETIEPKVSDFDDYKLTLMKDYQEYIKRLIIKVDNPRGWEIHTQNYGTLQEELNPEIYEILKPLQ